MKRTTLCPCGSGKPQALCCGDNPKSRISLRAIVIWSFIILLGGAIAVIAVRSPSIETPIPAVRATPAPYQYDPITNKHWDPAHAHWHDGPSPLSSTPTDGAIQLSTSSGPAIALPTAPRGSKPTSGDKVSPPPNITNPTDWQYDIATDRHYDPHHAHWHSGRALNDPARVISSPSGTEVPAPPNITNPTAWQYDTTTDRHYDPNHAHWHSGSPPGGT